MFISSPHVMLLQQAKLQCSVCVTLNPKVLRPVHPVLRHDEARSSGSLSHDVCESQPVQDLGCPRFR